MQMVPVEPPLLGSIPLYGGAGGGLVELQLSSSHHQSTYFEVEWGSGRVVLRESVYEELEVEGLVSVLVDFGFRADKLRPTYADFLLDEGHQIDLRSDSGGLEHQGVLAVVKFYVIQYNAP